MSKQIKIVLTLFIILNSVSTSFAQEKEKKKNIFGVLIGRTFSDITDYEGNIKQGIVAGLYWELELTKKFSYMSNIFYSQRGEKGKYNLNDINLAYLNTPFSVKYNISSQLGVSTGVNWDFLLSVDGEDVNKDDFKQSDLGIPIGISYNISDKIQMGVIYVYGLIDITKNDTLEMKNNWGSISIAYLFK